MGKDLAMDRIMLLLDEILKNFDAYDGSPEAGMELIQANQLAFDSLRELVGEGASLDSQYLDKLELIIEKQNTLVEVLKKEKEDLLGKLEQINTKGKLVNSYLSPEVKPVFIDKDMWAHKFWKEFMGFFIFLSFLCKMLTKIYKSSCPIIPFVVQW